VLHTDHYCVCLHLYASVSKCDVIFFFRILGKPRFFSGQRMSLRKRRRKTISLKHCCKIGFIHILHPSLNVYHPLVHFLLKNDKYLGTMSSLFCVSVTFGGFMLLTMDMKSVVSLFVQNFILDYHEGWQAGCHGFLC
jgi:hypothetical protein